jgi:hypothetical protein
MDRRSDKPIGLIAEQPRGFRRRYDASSWDHTKSAGGSGKIPR